MQGLRMWGYRGEEAQPVAGAVDVEQLDADAGGGRAVHPPVLDVDLAPAPGRYLWPMRSKLRRMAHWQTWRVPHYMYRHVPAGKVKGPLTFLSWKVPGSTFWKARACMSMWSAPPGWHGSQTSEIMTVTRR